MVPEEDCDTNTGISRKLFGGCCIHIFDPVEHSLNTLFFVANFFQNHNYADGRLAVLLEMNDYVTAVLSKVDLVEIGEEEAIVARTLASSAAAAAAQDHATTTHNSTAVASTALHVQTERSTATAAASAPPNPRSQSADYYSTPAAVPTLQLQHPAAAPSSTNFPSVVSAVYALRRGGNRQETLHAVDNLIQLCNFGGELCLPAVKQMMAAGKIFNRLFSRTDFLFNLFSNI